MEVWGEGGGRLNVRIRLTSAQPRRPRRRRICGDRICGDPVPQQP